MSNVTCLASSCRVGLLTVLLAIVLMVGVPVLASAHCPDANVLTETFSRTCWECIFPISLVGVTIMNTTEDNVDPAVGPGLATGYPPQLCGCLCIAGVCIPGLPLGMFVPNDLVEVVRQPFCFPSLGGVELTPLTFIDGGLSSDDTDDIGLSQAYYHVHLVFFPLWSIIGMGLDVVCANITGIGDDLDVVYMTELDPTWSDDTITLFLFPEAFLLANPVATASCAVDSAAAAFTFPIDALFWCAGSFGNMYPPTGNVSGPWGGQIKPAALAMSRMLARLSRVGTEWYTAGNGPLICTDYPTFLIVKSQYKFQLLHPIPNTTPGCCWPMGRTGLRWGLAKTYPVEGEDFVFLLWKLQRCCML